MTIGQMSRKIIRTKYRQNTMGTMAQHRFSLGHWRMFFASALLLGLQRDGDFADHRLDFGQRLPAWLAGFLTDGLRQLDFVLGQQRGKTLNNLHPPGMRSARPIRKCITRRLTGGIHILRAGAKRRPEQFMADRITFFQQHALSAAPLSLNKKCWMGHDSLACDNCRVEVSAAVAVLNSGTARRISPAITPSASALRGSRVNCVISCGPFTNSARNAL